MKKQILLLIVFALFANIGIVLAQPYAIPYTPRQDDLECETDPLHPTAGVPYEYKMTATPGGGMWKWWATKNTEFIDENGLVTTGILTKTDGELLEHSDNYNVATVDPDGNTVTITWSEEILAATEYQVTPTFVVGYYEASQTGTDCADNIKIYELNPVHAFVVDVLSLDPATFLPDATDPFGYEPDQCVDHVRGASYKNGCIEYDYGTNILYYEFIAANFSNFWKPTFRLDGLDAAQTVVYEYTVTKPEDWDGNEDWYPLTNDGTTEINVESTTSTANGVSIFVRVTVSNNTYETTAAQTITLYLDGQNSLDKWDVIPTTCLEPNTGADEYDLTVQVINPRPTLEDAIDHINTDEPNDVIDPCPAGTP
jgi:hypothetical protein